MGLSSLFKAMSDDTRREILRLLAKGDLNAGEIAQAFNLTRPTISHHLNILKEAGLVQDERRGSFIVYSLNTTVLQDLTGWVFEMLPSLATPKATASKKEDHGHER